MKVSVKTANCGDRDQCTNNGVCHATSNTVRSYTIRYPLGFISFFFSSPSLLTSIFFSFFYFLPRLLCVCIRRQLTQKKSVCPIATVQQASFQCSCCESANVNEFCGWVAAIRSDILTLDVYGSQLDLFLVYMARAAVDVYKCAVQ
jgi:hypothetical protein